MKSQLARSNETNRSLEALRAELEVVREEQGGQLSVIRELHSV